MCNEPATVRSNVGDVDRYEVGRSGDAVVADRSTPWIGNEQRRKTAAGTAGETSFDGRHEYGDDERWWIGKEIAWDAESLGQRL